MESGDGDEDETSWTEGAASRTAVYRWFSTLSCPVACFCFCL
jgi:hypothetical protein